VGQKKRKRETYGCSKIWILYMACFRRRLVSFTAKTYALATKWYKNLCQRRVYYHFI